MIQFLVHRFINKPDEIQNLEVREQYGILSSSVGIVANIFLFVAKFFIGSMTNSISITSDAFNNLSDMASAIFTFFGYKLAAKPADDDHPFGHGRIEYLVSLVIAAAILFVGFEFLINSIEKIITPEPIIFSFVAALVLIVSIGVKLWLARFNFFLGHKIQSSTMIATANDSKSDVLATVSTFVALVASLVTSLPVDGIMGCFVSFFILKAGFGIIKDTVDTLIGMKADPELASEIKSLALDSPNVVGVHDLMVHNYGPGRMFASLHAEIPSHSDLMEIHEEMDRLERDIKAKTHVVTVIHMDPIVIDDPKRDQIKAMAIDCIHQIDARLHLHDFRMVDGVERINVVFDLVKPYDLKISDQELKKMVQALLRKQDERITCIIEIEHEFA